MSNINGHTRFISCIQYCGPLITLQVLHRKFGISESGLECYSTYLKLKRFRVCINGCYLTEKTLLLSLPQGSIQGAILFISYASTIPEIIPDSLQHNGYADDHSLRKSFKPGIIHELTTNTNIDDETCTTAIIKDIIMKV